MNCGWRSVPNQVFVVLSDAGRVPQALFLVAPAREWLPRPSRSLRRAGTTNVGNQAQNPQVERAVDARVPSAEADSLHSSIPFPGTPVPGSPITPLRGWCKLVPKARYRKSPACQCRVGRQCMSESRRDGTKGFLRKTGAVDMPSGAFVCTNFGGGVAPGAPGFVLGRTSERVAAPSFA